MRWLTVGILFLAAFFATAARGDIYQWEYIDPLHTELGRQQSSTLAPDGAGLAACAGSVGGWKRPDSGLPGWLQPHQRVVLVCHAGRRRLHYPNKKTPKDAQENPQKNPEVLGRFLCALGGRRIPYLLVERSLIWLRSAESNLQHKEILQ